MRKFSFLLVPAALALAAAALAPAAHAQDAAIRQLLISTPWCTVGMASPSPGLTATAQERAVFGSNGVVVVTGNVQNTMAMGGMSMSNSNWQTRQYSWDYQAGSLLMSPDGKNFVPVSFEAKMQGGGAKAIVIDGDEYRPCK